MGRVHDGQPAQSPGPSSPPRFSVILLLAIAVSLAVTALVVAIAAPRVVRLVLTLPISVFPGGRGAVYYAGQLRQAALGWAVALPMVVLVTGAALHLWCEARRARSPVRWNRWLVTGGLFLLMIGFAAVPRQLTGDEPTYLAMAQSVARDHNLVINGDPSLHLSLASPTPRAIHDPGLGLLLALPLAVGGSAGATIALALVGVTFLMATRTVLARHIGADEALLVVLLSALSFPVVIYARFVLPEIAGALGLIVLHRSVVQRRQVDIPAIVSVAALPWLHVRFLPGALVYAAASLYFSERRRWALEGIVAPLAISLGVMALFHLYWFGSLSPFAAWAGHHGLLSLANLVPGAVGLAFDQQYGLLVWAPVFLLAPLGLAELWRRATAEAIVLVGAIALTVGPGILHVWWGGWSPAARFLVPVTGQLLVLAGLGIHRIRLGGPSDRRVAGVFLLMQWLIGLICVLVPGKVYGTMEPSPRNYYLDFVGRLLHIDPTWLLPSVRAGSASGAVVHAAVLTALWLVLSLAWLRRLDRISPVPSPPSGGAA